MPLIIIKGDVHMINIMDEIAQSKISLTEILYLSEEISLDKLPKKISTNISKYFLNMKVGEVRLAYLIKDTVTNSRKNQDKYLILSCHDKIVRVYYPNYI